jgi:signal peptidase II
MKLRKLYLHAISSVGIVFIDLISKSLVLNFWNKPFQVASFFSIETSLNKGVTWSCFSAVGKTQSVALMAIIAMILSGFLYFLIVELKRRGSAIPEMLIFSGGVSNLIDRFWRGGVIDFLSFNIGDWYWPTFNIADIFIFLGVTFLVIKTIKEIGE